MLTLRGMFRYLKLKLKREEVFVDGSCHQCGNCCKHIYLFTGPGKVVKNQKQYDKMVKKDPETSRFEIIADEGNALVFKCNWLTDENKCKDHEHRLQLCKNYPAKIMYYTDFVTGKDCGYTIRTGKPFSKTFKKLMGNK